MRKRSKKRIPQDTLAWSRVTQLDDNLLNFFNKKTTRWVSGYNRDLQTKIILSQIKSDLSKTLLKSYFFDQRIVGSASVYRSQLQHKISKLDAKSALSKPKNFCLFLGKGSTYNRKLFISRQIFRKLVGTGLISGLQKS